VLRATERPAAPGLYLMDTPFFSPESITAMVAAGAQLVVFTTGAGNSYGSALAPTFKVSANADACARLGEQIDFAASAVLDGTESFDDTSARALGALVDVASGTLTFGEIVGEGAEVVSRLAPSI
jgi:altronate dehydratase large subunit